MMVRHVLPLAISGAALVYVFGFAIDWQAIPEATERANMPLFVAITIVDKVFFFLVWTLVQASMVRRFLAPVPRRQIIAVKGGAELARAVNNSISDAAFFLGVLGLPVVGYTVYLFYTGVPVVMRIPPERGFLFSSAVLAFGMVALVAMLAVTVILWSQGFGPSFKY